MKAITIRAWRRLARTIDRRRVVAAAGRLREWLSRRDPPGDGLPVFVVVVPRTLGWLEPCLKLVPSATPVYLIGNGLSASERRAVESATGRRLFALPVLPGSYVKHGTALDLLLETVEGDFILLDHDCYILDPALFAAIDWRPGEALAAVRRQGFVLVNEATGLVFPRTHFLVVRGGVLSEVARRHRLSCEKQTRTPRRVRELVGQIGLGDHNFPPPHLDFWDTLQLIVATAVAEGASVRWLEAEDGAIEHVGGTARLRNQPGATL